jgi:hypothetical protein
VSTRSANRSGGGPPIDLTLSDLAKFQGVVHVDGYPGFDRLSDGGGSDGGAARWAVVASLLTTAKLNNVEPFAYLKDVLERMSNGHPMSRLDELLPWNWGRSIGIA